MSKSSARLYNLISWLFLLMTLGMIGFVAYMFATSEPEEVVVAAQPTRFVEPTLTDTLTPTETSTVTPSLTSTITITPSATLSLTPSVTSTRTITPTWTITPSPTITYTPSISPTFTVTHTATATPTPTGPSLTPTTPPSPFLFDLRTPVEYVPNTVNVAGCAWQSIAGNVLDIAGASSAQRYRVHVYNNNLDIRVETGTNSFYDQPTNLSGWEVQVASSVTLDTYFVQLESLAGTPISPAIQVTFSQDCAGNVALVRFAQQREF